MRTHLSPAVMTALARCCMFAWIALPQAALAEQRLHLRAGRAEEATPFITLPQSLLLQSSDGRQADEQAEEHGLSNAENAEASKEIQAASSRSGYGNELWNAVQESASEVVDDAREAFFAGDTKVTLKWYTKAEGWTDAGTYAGAVTFCAGKGGSLPTFAQLCPEGRGKANALGELTGDHWAPITGDGDNAWVEVGKRSDSVQTCEKHHLTLGRPTWGTAASSYAPRNSIACTDKAAVVTTTTVTTTVAVTTVDPAILAAQLKVSQDAAKARNMLVSMITKAQLDLLNRLNDIGIDLNATEARAHLDLKAVNHSFQAAKNMPIMASNAAVDVQKIDTNGDALKISIPKIGERADAHKTQIASILSTKQQLEKDIAASKAIKGAKRRVQNNQQTLGAIVPRLEKLERKVTKLESRLYDGNLTRMVKDVTGKEVMNIMEDVSRGFGRFVENAK